MAALSIKTACFVDKVPEMMYASIKKGFFVDEKVGMAERRE